MSAGQELLLLLLPAALLALQERRHVTDSSPPASLCMSPPRVYTYKNRSFNITDQRFSDRVHWNGSKNTEDLQDGSIFILNVTFNDSGTYLCEFNRTLKYLNFKYQTYNKKMIVMRVVPRRTRGLASILSEVMMYVSIIGLQVKEVCANFFQIPSSMSLSSPRDGHPVILFTR
ncbi:Sodium channel subunit beta-1 [Liparis tanakae]|uniref:Sodium channel regulatory subunit beta-1 n=1 Tax=Liparis tanakae TaxID=230148 RepID=A0A4Z2HQ60_9TELE|nr:Sodium channel subunit beta-1 [Liparis tanakae]